MRQWSSLAYRWRYLLLVCVLTYVLVLCIPGRETLVKDSQQLGADEVLPADLPAGGSSKLESQIVRGKRIEKEKKEETEEENEFVYEFRPVGKEPFFVTEVLTNFGISLKTKMTCKADKTAPPKILLSINAGHGQEHLGGCPDWNCELTHDRSKVDKADAVMLAYDDASFVQKPDQYVIYYSQESPKNSGFSARASIGLNMTLGYRHDSAAASPYGYTVRLAKRSHLKPPFANSKRIAGKTKPAAWFVSHCNTNSWREKVVERMQKDITVDVYGTCGKLSCPRGGACEDMLDNDYFFYIAFENSICQDYMTEKLWSQGYQREILPVVLKRKLVEPFVPPNSFLALDDYKSTEDLAAHMHFLMKNLTAYEEYFSWKRNYKVLFLNGQNHDVLERPWGFCQVCRLMWEQPKKHYSIENWNKYWEESCETDGQLASVILNNSQERKKAT